MKTFRLMSILTMLCGLFGCQASAQKAGEADYTSLSVNDYERAIADSSVVRLDVRTAEEYAEGHIEGAINIDVLMDNFLIRATTTLPHNHTIAVNCRSGKRSKDAAAILARKGYRVVELDAGHNAWKEAGKPTTKEETDLFLTPSGTPVYLFCIKHGSVKMKLGHEWVYVDPVTDGVQPTTDFTAMPKADLILVTHAHHDHLDAKAIQQLTKAGTTLVVNGESCEKLGGKGTMMKNGESRTFGRLQVDAVPAYNTSADKQQFHPRGRDNGYVLTFDGLRIYIGGDTEDIPEMADIKDIDVAFLPCNLPYTMTPEQAARAARSVKPRVLFPYHYGQTDIQQVANLLKGTGIDVSIRQYQ